MEPSGKKMEFVIISFHFTSVYRYRFYSSLQRYFASFSFLSHLVSNIVQLSFAKAREEVTSTWISGSAKGEYNFVHQVEANTNVVVAVTRDHALD